MLLDSEVPVDGFVELALARAAYEARLGGDLDIKEEEIEDVVIKGALDEEFGTSPVPQSTWLTPRSATEGRVPAVILTAVKTLKQGTCYVPLVGLSDFTL